MNVHGGSCSVLVLLFLCACLHVVHQGHIVPTSPLIMCQLPTLFTYLPTCCLLTVLLHRWCGPAWDPGLVHQPIGHTGAPVLFAGIGRVEFSEGNTSITVLTLQEREVVSLSNLVVVTTNEEVWLANLTSVMQHTPLAARGSANHRSMEGLEDWPYKIPFPGTGAQEYVHSCVRSALYEESMKGFQMHLRICVGISRSHSPVFFNYVLQIKCIFKYTFFCLHGTYVHTYVHTYVFMPFVLCYMHGHVRLQLTNTILP